MDGGAEVAMLMLSDASLDRLAGELGNDWFRLGIFLGVPKAQVDQCFINRPSNVRAATVDMLVMWRQETSENGPKAQVADLVQALKEIDRVDLAEKVEDGDFIGHPDQGAGNRKYPYQEAGNRAEATGGRNIIIQTGDNANISLAAPFTGRGAANEGYGAAASAMPTPGYTSLPDLPRMQPPRHMPRAFSQDGIQHSQEDILEDCIRKLQEMGIADHRTMRHYRQEVQNLISTGLNPQAIVQTIVERTQEHEETSGQWSSPHTVHSSKDSVTVSDNKGPVQIGKENIIRGDLDSRSLKKAVQIGEKNSILPHSAENQNLGRKHDRRSTNQQQSFPTQPQQGRFVDDSTAGEITSSARNRRLVEQLPQDRAAGQMAREVPPSDGQDWPPIPENVSSSSEEPEVSVNNPGESSTFDSLDGSTPTNKAPLYVALPEEKSPSISSMAEMELGISQQNPTGGSPSRSTDESLIDESLRLQSGGYMQDNLASNRPEAGINSSADDGDDVPVRPLGDLYPESSRTMPALLDCSIPSMGQQWPPLSPLPAVQQNTVNAQALQSDPQLSQKQEDETIGGVEEPSNLREHQPTEVVAAASGEDTTADVGPDDVSTSDEETLPKAPLEDASANEAATAAPASDQLHPAETREQVEEGADRNQPVYDTERRLYIFTTAHIQKLTENFSPSKKKADGAFGPVYYLEKFPYDGPLKGRQMAVKVNSSDDQGRREFMQELAMAGSRHPHLLPLFGICEDENCLSLVSPYMANKDLKSWIKDKTSPTDWKTRLVIGLDLISAIRHYHKQTKGPNKRFHCDVKSANVFLDAQLRARLGDPGLMREVSKDKTHLTRTGSLSADWGTSYYQDPSFVKYQKYHEKSDLYSAGKVLLELFTSITADKEENGRLLFEVWSEDLDYFDKQSDGTELCEVADRSSAVGWPECSEDGASVTQQSAKLIIGCLQERLKDRITLDELYKKLKVLVQTSAAIGKHNKAVPDWCMHCLTCKPCPIPMACGCALLCSACMKSDTEALYCPNHHMDTTGLGYNTFAIIVGQSRFEDDATSFKVAITNPNICGVREENVKLLLNSSLKDVEDAMAELVERIQQVPKGQETFFIYYHSGHGQQRILYFKKDDETAPVMSAKLRRILRGSKATKSLFILDSCYASSVEVYTMKGPGGPDESSSSIGETEQKEQEQEHLGDNTGCQGSQERDVWMLPEGSMLWASSRKTEASGKKPNSRLSVFTKYIIQGLQGGNCGADNCSDCMSFQQQARAAGAVNLNLLHDYVFEHVTEELQGNVIPSLQGHQEKTYWMAYAQE